MNRHVTNQRQNHPQPLRKPLTVGIWRLTAQIHAGRWCDLYAAQPADAVGSPRNDYAVKIARLPSSEDPEAAGQIRTEAAAAAAARHPNVVPVLDGQLNAARPYVVMPRFEGAALADTVTPARVQPLPVVLWWARQCAQGLAALHANGWVHGDLKPENIMVDPRGHVTLIDLGLASRQGSNSGALFRGTPDYAAPEKIAGGTANDVSADIYSLGRVVERMLGEEPPQLQSITEIIAAMTTADARRRPSAMALVDALLQMEIDTLHLHIQPVEMSRTKAA